ncbi:hypothetical protein ACP275_07G001900 [Erythranthe tilingii]
MAVSISKLVIIYFLMISILSSNISAAPSNDLINEFCKKTNNSQICSKTLKSNWRAVKASSRRALGEIVSDMAIACADSTTNLLNSLERVKNSQHIQEKYKKCWVYYAFIYNYVVQAKQSFKNSDAGGVEKNIKGALTQLSTCQQQFRKPVFEPKKLKQENEKLSCLCSVSLIIAHNISAKSISST